MPNEAGRTLWEHETGRYLVGTGSQWFVIGDNAASSLGGLSPAPPAAQQWQASINRIRKRNGWASLAISPQRSGANIAASATSNLGTIPTGFRPMDDFEIVGHVPSSGARVTGKVFAATGLITLTFWGGGIETNRFANLQAVSWPVNY
ncbi:hypothetical protein [Verrucosispora sp. TAA-831]